MNSEITDHKVTNPFQGTPWVLYDGNCSLCTRLVRRVAPALKRNGYDIAPLQARWVAPTLGLSEPDLLQEMRLLEADGTYTSGATAVVRLSRCFWWARPIIWIARLPGGMAFLNQAYRWVANRRACAQDACVVPRPTRSILWPTLGLVVALLLITVMTFSNAERWLVMWGIAGAIWLVVKVFTLREIRRRDWRVLLAYLLAWPGTDACSFSAGNAPLPSLSDWRSGALNLAIGIILLMLAPSIAAPLASGWLAMIGLVLTLHFGAFQLLSSFWRSRGVDARPLMDRPLQAMSLGEFWGRRWNTGFSTPARRYLFEPLKRKVGPTTALMCVFLASGMLHEAAISLPAQGAYGLPMLYFAFQGAAVLFERSRAGKRLGLGHGIRGRVFAWLCVAGPAFWLFHPPFVERVILPFLNAIHSTKGAFL